MYIKYAAAALPYSFKRDDVDVGVVDLKIQKKPYNITRILTHTRSPNAEGIKSYSFRESSFQFFRLSFAQQRSELK